MRTALRGIAVLAVVVVSSAPATAHHSNPLYFDMTKAITLEGLILRVEWINPHALIFLQSKNEKGELETWTIQGASPVNFNRKTSSRIVGGGQVRLSNGDVLDFGGGPTF
jgi:hypothetical protein